MTTEETIEYLKYCRAMHWISQIELRCATDIVKQLHYEVVGWPPSNSTIIFRVHVRTKTKKVFAYDLFVGKLVDEGFVRRTRQFEEMTLAQLVSHLN